MFTTAEYIAKQNLDVSVQDPWATRMINKHLRKLGYERRRKSGRWVWLPKGTDNPASGRNDLAAKLSTIEKEAANGKMDK